ncbi:MAG: GMC oxidoreductase [Imperialibacter sp.]|uniref:GMC oxidoreductase n=1 Tax=Imperialibacter sp. TaxID=2038411 RepID=UPI003A872906
MNLNLKAKQQNSYDAIVVGTGISGGWAAKELTEKGLKTLVLERGRMVRHVADYPTMNLNPWELENGDRITAEEQKDYEKQNRTGYTVKNSTKHWWIKDTDQPYSEVKRFDWIRGYHVGGRSIMWGRQSYRLGEFDFEANAKDGIAVDWPIRYADIAPWYDYAEQYIGVNGIADGWIGLPDGKYLPPMEMNCIEKHVKQGIESNFKDRIMTMGRSANITQDHNGRHKCMYRNLCIRGCPFGGYFSSNASTLPAAEATGNMELRPNSIVHSVIYDEAKGKATGVRVIDAETLETVEYFANIIFLNASTINTTSIMLNSISDRFPNGLGNDSGELGHNLMDHHFRVGARADFDGFEDEYYVGRRPNGIYIPRFRNIGSDKQDYIRGYGYQGGGSRDGWGRGVAEMEVGPQLKEMVMTPGKWGMGLTGFGEMLPYHENKMVMNNDLKDKWGMPTVTFDCEIKENELKMRVDMKEQAVAMLEAAGMKNVTPYDDAGGPGLGIHEMGTARMGRDPKTSVLNKWNQVHACKNVFVTDGSAMTSASCVNPSLTYMALTARAADYAVKEMKKQNL